MTKKTTPEIALNPDQVRQGDVFLERVNELPAWASRPVQREGERIVIEHGEASNHAHALREPVTCFRATTAEMAANAGLDAVLVGGAGATLRHEYPDGAHAEHAAITLKPGAWVRAVQVDRAERAARRMAD